MLAPWSGFSIKIQPDDLTACESILFRQVTITQLVKKSPAYMQPKIFSKLIKSVIGLIRKNAVDVRTSNPFQIRFNIILPSAPSFPKRSLSFYEFFSFSVTRYIYSFLVE
jgi:hypothetical protein